jgi:hypothetical protein
MALRPKEVALVYTPGTAKAKDRLSSELDRKSMKVTDACIPEATDAVAVLAICREAFRRSNNAHLNYTGGTKVMAAHARLAFQEAGGRPADASYLDEPAGLVRFDDGTFVALGDRDLELTLDTVVRLHGIERWEPKLGTVSGVADARRVAAVALRMPVICNALYGIYQNASTRTGKLRPMDDVPPQDLSSLDVGLPFTTFPEASWKKETYKEWAEFLRGGWLELWVGELVRGIAGQPVMVGVDCWRKSRQFEVDVAVVHHQRLYLISCTTATDFAQCRAKLFEAAFRAPQLGGDLARFALVCLLEDAEVAMLAGDAAETLDLPGEPRVYGRSALAEWLGLRATADLGSLQRWLDS